MIQTNAISLTDEKCKSLIIKKRLELNEHKFAFYCENETFYTSETFCFSQK